ncbi:prepilin peptidase [Candidatus Peregrinibacteria bacterium]|nr:prepilin peptidase [Candidatus Peregrinibacteria bacterium]
MPSYFFLLLMFVLGLVFGSFASVVIHRLHTRQEGILWGRSECPRCHHRLRVLDLIPLAGYVFNKFHCHFCQKPIAAVYPLLEIAMGTAFWLTAIEIGNTSIPALILFCVTTFVLVTVSFYDMLYREIPDELMLPAIIVTLVALPLLKIATISSILWGALIPLLFFGGLFFGSSGRWLGGGDIRLGVFMGLLLGWPLVLVGLFLAYLMGSFYSLIGIVTKKLNRKSAISFGPFLALGTFAGLFWGKTILEWYLKTF